MRILVISPYAPRFPFETWVIPRVHNSHFESAQPSLIQSLAWAMRAIVRKMEKVLEYPAYNFLIHTSPIHAAPLDHYHWHLEIIPRLKGGWLDLNGALDSISIPRRPRSPRNSYATLGSEAAASRGVIQ